MRELKAIFDNHETYLSRLYVRSTPLPTSTLFTRRFECILECNGQGPAVWRPYSARPSQPACLGWERCAAWPWRLEGDEIYVTEAKRREYVDAYVRFNLTRWVQHQFEVQSAFI